MITQNRNPTNRTSDPAETPLTGRYAAPGRYTDTNTLIRGDARRAVRPGSYTDVDTLTRPKSDIVRPGSYVDMDARLPRLSDLGRPGSYIDTDRSAG